MDAKGQGYSRFNELLSPPRSTTTGCNRPERSLTILAHDALALLQASPSCRPSTIQASASYIGPSIQGCISAGGLRQRAESSPELGEVHHVQGRDVVGLALEVGLPEALLPEPEAVHVLVVVAEGRVRQGGTLQTGTSSEMAYLDIESNQSILPSGRTRFEVNSCSR